MTESEGAPREGREPLAATVSFQVRSLIASAERAGAAMRAQAEQGAAERLRRADEEADRRVDEARREADRLLDERRRRLAELSDAVAARAERVLGELDSASELREALDGALHALTETIAALGREVDSPTTRPEPQATPSGPEPEEAPASEPRAVTPVPGQEGDARRAVPQPATAAVPTGHDATGLSGPRLVAHQMAVAGSTRAEVAAHLRRTFGLHEAHGILNELFPDSDAGSGSSQTG